MPWLIILTIAISIVIYGVFIEPNLLKKEYFALDFKTLPDKFEGLKIAHISDIHYSRPSRVLSKVIDVLHEEKPDITVITGDFLGHGAITNLEHILKEVVKHSNNVFAVLGNWDHKVKDSQKFAEFINSTGIKLLINESKTIEREDEKIIIAGVDDPYLNLDNLHETFRNVPEDIFVILLSHSPDVFYKATNFNPSLILTGHTHGGQVLIPLLRKALYVPSIFGEKFLSGLYKIFGIYLYVNRGIGSSHLRVRFLSPPEITIIKLQRKVRHEDARNL